MVPAWVGKGFPDMRQNERENKAYQSGRCCYNSGPAQGRTDIEVKILWLPHVKN